MSIPESAIEAWQETADSANGGDWVALALRCGCLPLDEACAAFIDPRCVAAADDSPLLRAELAGWSILDAGRDLVAHALKVR